MINEYISQFEILEKKFPGSIPNSIYFDFGNHPGHIAFSSIIHGNETGSLPSILKTVNMLAKNEIKYYGKVTFFLGNKFASLQNKRFIDYDLNRCFNYSAIKEKSLEAIRANEIKKILNQADVYLDFHQTTIHCKEPFYIFAMHSDSYLWARAIGICTKLITRNSKRAYSSEGMCSDEYMRSLNKVGITLELGEQGFNKSADKICFNALKKSLWLMDQIYLKKRPINTLARKNNDFIFLEIKHAEKFLNNKKRLFNELYNLQFVKKNTKLGINEDGKIFYSPFDGFIVFPQYPERNEQGLAIDSLPAYIYSLASPSKKLT